MATGRCRCPEVLEELGADYLAVSSLDEAMELRAGGIHMPILILGHTPPERVEELLRYHITQTVTCEAKALEYSAEAVRGRHAEGPHQGGYRDVPAGLPVRR